MSAEYFARIQTATNRFYGFSTSPITTAHPDESVVSIGVLPFPPDERTERYDGAGGVRAATAQEITDYDAAKLDAAAQTDIDGLKALKALALVLADEVSKTPAQIRNAVIAKYKTL